ncbi:MAG: glycosyltransferase family 2 protein [Deltaproteobacteria bacterium]|nr:glycosyltransferase family 2 protein [Deltaproteobacteria bacterium]
MPDPCDLSIIIVNYNTQGYLGRCLESLSETSDFSAEIIVVDNASKDLSAEMVRERFPEAVLIANTENLGFAKANNQAIAVSMGRYLYFLNPDAEVQKGAFGAMISYMETHPDVGLAGTRLVNPDGSTQPSVESRYPGQKHAKKLMAGLKGDIAWVLGASMIARRSAIMHAGGFNEDFFLYGEEQDLCLRLRRAGWSIGYIPDAVVLHWGGKSERDHLPENVWEKKFRAELTFYHSHYSSNAIKRICMENLIQAMWRIILLKLTLPFYADKTRLHHKLDKYRVAFRVFLRTLQNHAVNIDS